MVAKSEQASLWTLYLTAYRLYQREVIEQKKLYKRFKDDFINGNTYPKRCDVDGLNEHNKNLGILRELLENRLDLIEKYFVRPSFEHKDYLAMQHELDTTEVGSTTISEAPHIKPLTLDSNVSSEMFEGLAKVLNDTHVFTTSVTVEQVEAMLALKLSSPLKADVNRKVVTFFDALRSHNLIANNWQKIIADSGFFISSATNSPITYTSVADASGEYVGKKWLVLCINLLDYILEYKEIIKAQIKRMNLRNLHGLVDAYTIQQFKKEKYAKKDRQCMKTFHGKDIYVRKMERLYHLIRLYKTRFWWE